MLNFIKGAITTNKSKATSKYMPHQGYKEMARRRGEIGMVAKAEVISRRKSLK